MPSEPMIGGAAATPVKDVTTATFMADVVDGSFETPVIVDFWAPWCGPCKQLGPILEKAVRAAKGAVRMVKLNIDENPEIAQQMRIQSIPAVYAFKDGRPVDGFVGALPESQVKQFVQRVGGGKGGGPSPVEEAMAMAKEALQAGDHASAGAVYSQVLQREPDNVEAQAGLARALIAQGDLTKARQAARPRCQGERRPCRDRRGARGARSRRAGGEGDGVSRQIARAPGAEPQRPRSASRSGDGIVRHRRARGRRSTSSWTCSGAIANGTSRRRASSSSSFSRPWARPTR